MSEAAVDELAEAVSVGGDYEVIVGVAGDLQRRAERTLAGGEKVGRPHHPALLAFLVVGQHPLVIVGVGQTVYTVLKPTGALDWLEQLGSPERAEQD